MKKLKSDSGKVVEVEDYSCYRPDKDGYIMAALAGFAYFTGKETEEEPTHAVRMDGGLFGGMGDLIPIGDCNDEIQTRR